MTLFFEGLAVLNSRHPHYLADNGIISMQVYICEQTNTDISIKYIRNKHATQPQ